MGAVYRGYQSYLERDVAVKFLKDAEADDQFTARFEREAKTLAQLEHPNIVSCYQAGVADDGQCYLVMAFIDGPNLGYFLQRNGPLSYAAGISILRSCCLALQHALKKDIIHRDIKPDNILLFADDSSPILPTKRSW